MQYWSEGQELAGAVSREAIFHSAVSLLCYSQQAPWPSFLVLLFNFYGCLAFPCFSFSFPCFPFYFSSCCFFFSFIGRCFHTPLCLTPASGCHLHTATGHGLRFSQRGASSHIWDPRLTSGDPVLEASTQGTPLDHLAMEAWGVAFPSPWDCNNQRGCYWLLLVFLRKSIFAHPGALA